MWRKTWLILPGWQATGGEFLESGLHADRLLVELVAEGLERRAEGGVEVHLLVFGLVEPGEVAEVLHDRADALRARRPIRSNIRPWFSRK